MSTVETAARSAPRYPVRGALLTWYATLGGAVAWTFHSLASWSVVETACSRDHTSLWGWLPVKAAIAVFVVLPFLVASSSGVLAVIFGRRITKAIGEGEEGLLRVRFMMSVGAVMNLLFCTVIVLGGVSNWVYGTCAGHRKPASEVGALGRLHLAAFSPAASAGSASDPQDTPAWILYVIVIAVLVGYAAGVARLWRGHPARGIGKLQAAFFGLGLISVVFAVTGPVDQAADDHFAAHMLQHSMLILVSAPLLAAGFPGLAFLLLLSRRSRHALVSLGKRPAISGLLAFLLHPVTGAFLLAIAVIGWHLPAPFDLSLQHPLVHDIDHVAILTAAFLYWRPLIRRGARRLNGATGLAHVVLGGLPMTAVGVSLTFAGQPLYPVQAARSVAVGVNPLADQQLAGAVMWIPGMIAMVLAAVAVMGSRLITLARSQPNPVLVIPAGPLDVRPPLAPPSAVPAGRKGTVIAEERP